jgi:hypothetical protein
MSTRPYETTNSVLRGVERELDLLIDWAEADACAAMESDAWDTARDDEKRVKALVMARELLKECYR